MSEFSWRQEHMSRRRRLQAQGVQAIIEGLQQREKPFVADLGSTAIAPTLEEQREYGWNSQGDYTWQPRDE